MNREIKFRAWDNTRMLTQGEAGVETIKSFFSNIGKHEVLMQFTGIFDKNDAEIYEGDIVRENDTMGIIQYLQDGFYVYDPGGISFRLTKTFEVIGNIYEYKTLYNTITPQTEV